MSSSTTYMYRRSPPKKSSSSSSFFSIKDPRDSASRYHAMDRKNLRESIYPLPRHPQSDADCVFIVVMGMTGAGKSTFINLLADKKVEVGHSLESCTTEVQVASFQTKSGKKCYLIDTPGFDDTNRSDTDILKEIAVFLTKLYIRKIHVTGLVYMHRITDPRMQGSAVKNLEVFQKLCGPQCFPHVALVSTMWQELPGPEGARMGEERETDLLNNDNFWGPMDKAKSRIFRHYGEKESAQAVADWFLNFQDKVVLNIQRELVDKDLTLDQTEAGKFLQAASAKVQEKYEKEIRQLQVAINDAHQERDSQTENELLLQRSDAEAALEKAGQSARQMRVNVQQLEAEKDPEYRTRVQEMEKQQTVTTSEEVSFLKTQLKEAREQNALLEQREKYYRNQLEAIRRQDNAKAKAKAVAEKDEQIALLEAELKRSQAKARAQAKASHQLEAELLKSSSTTWPVMELWRQLAPIFRNRHDPLPAADLEEDPPALMLRRRVGTGDSLTSTRRGGGDGRSRHER